MLGDLDVGRVIEIDRDFPNIWGTIARCDWLADPKSDHEKRVARFFELDGESLRLTELKDEGEDSGELDQINARLEDYLDLIESDDWYLLDESSAKRYILCPSIRHDGEIVWRWNPRR